MTCLALRLSSDPVLHSPSFLCSGPLTTIWDTYRFGRISRNVTAPIWVSAMRTHWCHVPPPCQGQTEEERATAPGIQAAQPLSPLHTFCMQILLIGAFGLVIGLATYGYKCTRGMGVRLSKLSPSRGFCAELATAAIILLASQYGLVRGGL